MDLNSINKQHDRGKLYVTERIDRLYDKGSFVKDSFSDDKDFYDGVYTGYGLINGRKVFFFGQDFTYMGGTFGINHSRQIVRTIEAAIASKCPIIGIYDGGGARVQEGALAVGGCGEIFNSMVRASGAIPMIAIVAGTCAGGAVYGSGLADFLYTIDDISNMFVTGSRVINANMGTDYLPEEIGGSIIHAKESGVSHFRVGSEEECYISVKKLLDVIPHFYGDNTIGDEEYVAKDLSLMEQFLPKNKEDMYDMKSIIYALFDVGSFTEIKEEFATNVITGLAKLGGYLVGVIANQPNVYNGAVDSDASDKVTRFINYLDAYDIPIITLVDSTNFVMDAKEEKKGLIRHGAGVIFSYSNSTVKKITLVVRRAYGGPFLMMGSKMLGASKVYAWPHAELAVMSAKSAVSVIYHSQMYRFEREDKEAYLDSKEKDYCETFLNCDLALKEGFVDEVINPSLTRDILYGELINKGRKDKKLICKKHGNMPI